MEQLAALTVTEQTELIFLAASEGRADVISKLLQVNSQLRTKLNADGASALHVAVCNGQLDSVRTLLRGGVPVEVVASSGTFEGKTARQLAETDDQGMVAVKGAFSAEMLQSVMLGDAPRTANLLRSGVSPLERVGPGTDAATLLAFAEDLLAPGETNPAVDLLQQHVAKSLTAGRRVAVDLPPQQVAPPQHPSASPLPMREGVPDVQLLQRKLEEKDALIDRLRSMLQEMAEEHEVSTPPVDPPPKRNQLLFFYKTAQMNLFVQVLNRLVHKQGSVSLTDHYRRLKQRIAEVQRVLARRLSPRG